MKKREIVRFQQVDGIPGNTLVIHFEDGCAFSLSSDGPFAVTTDGVVVKFACGHGFEVIVLENFGGGLDEVVR